MSASPAYGYGNEYRYEITAASQKHSGAYCTPDDVAAALASWAVGKPSDRMLDEGGGPVASIIRFHNALRELVGRRGIRNDVSRYEAIGFGLVEMEGASKSSLLASFPEEDSPLNLTGLFDTLYLRYDERFVTSAPDLASKTRRLEWDPASPGLQVDRLDYDPRIDDRAENQAV
jgi:hypothetical protein